MSHYNAVLDTPEMQRVRENQKNFSTVSFSNYLLCVFVSPSSGSQKCSGIVNLFILLKRYSHSFKKIFMIKCSGCVHLNIIEAFLLSAVL